MKILEYSLPIAFVLLLIIFFTGLPNLGICLLEEDAAQGKQRRLPGQKPGKGSLRSRLPLLLVTLIYSLTAFINLGNLKSPQSFCSLADAEFRLELSGDASPRTVVLYSGIGIGTVRIEYSPDGENFYPLTDFEQTHADVLKWHYIGIEDELYPRALRISAPVGSPYLGELALYDAEGRQISLSGFATDLYDEQGLVPASQNFMNSTHFDEVYHARTAWEHLHDIWPYEISHPPLGKLIIAAGILLFGMTPFGWRFSGTLFGCLMLPIMYAFIRRLFKNDKTALLGTIVFAADFMHFTQTRIATIDTYAVFFILLMYYYMYIYISEDSKKALALSGLFFGIGAASKWTCIYAGAGLALIWLCRWVGAFVSARREEGGAKALLPAFYKNVGFCLLFFVLVPCLVYYLSYFPYGIAERCAPFSAEYTRIVLDNQQFMLSYHVGVTAEHPYASRWYQWILNIRPILYYLEYFDDGGRSSIAAFLNPVTCWGGLMCLFVLIYCALFRKERKAAFILAGYLAQLLPWLFIKRLTFEYHYFPCSVFLVLAIAYVFELYRLNRKDWLKWCVPAAFMSVLLFVMFYPVLSGSVIDNLQGSRWLGWLPTWPI